MFFNKIWVTCFLAVVLCNKTGPIVETDKGIVMGVYQKTYFNKTIACFYSIPYAQQPTGNRRFKAPLPAFPWNGIYYANKTLTCPQLRGSQFIGDEACLGVDVYIPRTNINEITVKLPVIVNFHGGAFSGGSGTSSAGPDFIMERDVILVTLNYRLNILGFLSTQDDECPGNNGMKDQILALKWVQRNIAKFGGNPEEVTIMGFSTGATSVTSHYLSAQAKHLFRRGIAISGSLLQGGLQKFPRLRSLQIGKAFNCSTTTSKSMLNCLREKTAKELIEMVNVLQKNEVNYTWNFYAPCIEKNCKDAYMCKHPYSILADKEQNPANIIITTTQDEGVSPTAMWLNSPNTLEFFNNNWNIACPVIFNFNLTLSDSDKVVACAKLKEFYFNGKAVSSVTYDGLMRAFTDKAVLGIELNAKLLAAGSGKVYMYRYNYTAESVPTGSKALYNGSSLGVAHGDDFSMVFSKFHSGWSYFELTPNDLKMQKILWDLFLSFGDTGVPTSNDVEEVWLPMQASGDINFLQINRPDDIHMMQAESICNASLWNQFPIKENQLYDPNIYSD